MDGQAFKRISSGKAFGGGSVSVTEERSIGGIGNFRHFGSIKVAFVLVFDSES